MPRKSAVTLPSCRLSAVGDTDSITGSHPAPAFCGSYFLGVVGGAGAGGRVMGKFVSSTGGIASFRPLVPGTLAGLGGDVCGDVTGVEGGCAGIAEAAEGEAAFCRPSSKALVVRV